MFSSKMALVIASLSAVAFMAQAQNKDEHQNMSEPNAPAVTNATTAAALTDAEIANIVKTANDGEIDAGKLAAKKAENKEVKEFANLMVSEHKTNQSQTKDIAKKGKIKDKKNDISKELKKNVKDQMASLKKLKGAEFDKAYITGQIAMHEKVLDTLENKLIPSAQNPEMKTHLEMTKTHVQGHLAKAKDLEISLSK